VRETVAGLRGAFVALPVPGVALQFGDVLSATAGAFNALRPSLADQIGAAVICLVASGSVRWSAPKRR
jgi:hypothetical protein